MPLWWNWTYRSVWGRPKECTWWHVGDLGCATWISNNEPDGWTRTCWGELDMHSNNGRRTCTNGFHFDGHAVTPCKFLERLCNWYWLGSSLRALYFWDPWCETKTTQTKTYIETLETILDEEQQPSDFQICLLDFVRNKPEITFADLEHLCLWLDFTMGPAVQIWTNSNLPCD